MLLKNISNLSVLAICSMNFMLRSVIWKITSFNDISKLTNLIDAKLLISNAKLANLAIFLSS